MNVVSNKTHPEQQEGEIFLSNSHDGDAQGETGRTNYECIGWKSKRRGVTAYDVKGKVVHGCFPVFVQRDEIEAADPSIAKRLLG